MVCTSNTLISWYPPHKANQTPNRTHISPLLHWTILTIYSPVTMPPLWPNPMSAANPVGPMSLPNEWNYINCHWHFGAQEQTKQLCMGDCTSRPEVMERHRTGPRPCQQYVLWPGRSIQNAGSTLISTELYLLFWPQSVPWPHSSVSVTT